MVLRNFLYLNEQMLNDYLSAIEGYMATKVIQTTKQINTKNAGIGVNAKFLNGDLGKKTNNELETQMEVQITPVSKVQKLIDYLNADEPIKFYDSMNDEIWQSIQRDEVIEFMGTVRFSKLKEIANAVNELEKLCNALQNFTDVSMIDETAQKGMTGLKQLSELQNSNEVPCLLSFNSLKEYQVVCYLDEMCFNVKQESFVGDVTILCKIQKKVECGQSIELNDIFKSFRELPLNRAQRRQMPNKKSLETPKDLSDIVKGPAFVVTPIAIYK